MTKLEEKLIKLGYERHYTQKPYIWEKDFNDFILKISIAENIKGWVNVDIYLNFRKQKQIDNLQQAYNQLQQDLTILKECEQ